VFRPGPSSVRPSYGCTRAPRSQRKQETVLHSPLWGEYHRKRWTWIYVGSKIQPADTPARSVLAPGDSKRVSARGIVSYLLLVRETQVVE
jgi:hypothetical protein